MDKEWVFSDRNSDQYRAGLNAFFKYSLEHASFNGMIKCPCKKCRNIYYKLPHIIDQHLELDGMWPKYANLPWSEHGEPLPDAADNIAESSEPQSNSNLPELGSDSNIQDMLQDAFGMYDGEDDNMEPTMPTEGPSLPHGHTPDVENFYRLLEDADTDLYPGAGKKMFDFLIKLYQIKAMYSWSDVSFTELLKLLKTSLPPGETLPKSFYLTKKFIKSLGLTYQKIDACPNDCMLYWKDHASDTVCHICGTSRYKDETSSEGNNVTSPNTSKKIPAKVMYYFPLGSRLQRLFMSRHTSEFMVWHSKKRPKDGVLRHPADSLAWEELDKVDQNFASEGRNVRVGIASDGFNPFNDGIHSTWPVITTVYNLPPWLCMKKPYMMLTLLIPGPKSPGNNIDVYLQPLIEELKRLWTAGIPTYDAFKKEVFQMRATVLWTINDFPAYAMLSGYSTRGYKACPTCGDETDSVRLLHGKKQIYMGHRKWLSDDHMFRTWYKNFNGLTEFRRPPQAKTGVDCLREVSALRFNETRGGESNRKRKQVENSDNTRYTGPWKKKSIFFELPYWKYLLLRHNIDVMHVEKNVADSVIGTLLGMKDKTKDSLKARLDMVHMGIKHSLHPEPRGARTFLPPGKFTLTNPEKTLLCQILKLARVSDGFSSDIRTCVRVKERKLVNPKTHDLHIILQYLLPVAIRHSVNSDLAKVLLELSAFFRQLCTKVGTVDHFRNLSKRIAETLCKLEMLMPPSFFDIMVHLLIHLADEAAIAGPVQFRWMYPIERYLHDLKKYVRNYRRPEPSIAEGYIVEECLSFCTMYLSDGVESKRTRIGRNADDPWIVHREGLSIFVQRGRSIQRGHEFQLTPEERLRAHNHVLINCPDIDQYLKDHVAKTRQNRHRRLTIMEAERQARQTFHDYIQKVIEEKVQRREDVHPDIRALSLGPSFTARRYTKYVMNGFRFFIKSIDEKSNTQNCGVFVKAEVNSYASARDTRPRDGVQDYYGVLTDIIELDYHLDRKVLLFDCDWADNRVRNRGIKTDKYGFILVNFDRLLPKTDTLILASQALQFIYIEDPTDSNWHTVIRTRPRDLFDMGTDIEPEPYDNQNVVDGISNDDGIERTDIECVLLDESMDVDEHNVDEPME